MKGNYKVRWTDNIVSVEPDDNEFTAYWCEQYAQLRCDHINAVERYEQVMESIT